jgi:hypothetical protein
MDFSFYERGERILGELWSIGQREEFCEGL